MRGRLRQREAEAQTQAGTAGRADSQKAEAVHRNAFEAANHNTALAAVQADSHDWPLLVANAVSERSWPKFEQATELCSQAQPQGLFSVVVLLQRALLVLPASFYCVASLVCLLLATSENENSKIRI